MQTKQFHVIPNTLFPCLPTPSPTSRPLYTFMLQKSKPPKSATPETETETEKEPAEALNSFFQSVFVKEEEYQEEIDEADVGELLEDIKITEEV